MKITLCGSNSFKDKILQIKNDLETQEHVVTIPYSAEQGLTKEYWDTMKKQTPGDFFQKKSKLMHLHFDKIASSDAILVVNITKNDIENYIGGNTLMEMAIAFYLQKKIFLLNEIPGMSYTEEIQGMLPIVLDGDLKRI